MAMRESTKKRLEEKNLNLLSDLKEKQEERSNIIENETDEKILMKNLNKIDKEIAKLKKRIEKNAEKLNEAPEEFYEGYTTLGSAKKDWGIKED